MSKIKEYDKIGYVDEEELKSFAGAAEAAPNATPTITATVAIIIYTLSDSARSCPTYKVCSDRC